MEKTIQLDQREMQAAQGIEQQRINALAQVGALSLDMEQARKAVDVANEQQRSFIRQTLANRGIERFDAARPVPGGIVVSVPEPDAAAVPQKVNGAALPDAVAA